MNQDLRNALDNIKHVWTDNQHKGDFKTLLTLLLGKLSTHKLKAHVRYCDRQLNEMNAPHPI